MQGVVVDVCDVNVFVGRSLMLVLLLWCLLAGLGASLLIVIVLRAGGAGVLDEFEFVIAALTAIFNFGAVLMLLDLARRDGQFELLQVGRPTWVWLLLVCYTAGLSIGVLAVTYTATGNFDPTS